MNRIRTWIGLAAVPAMILLTAAGASAATAKPPPKPVFAPTIACQVTAPGTCDEPVVAIAQTSGNDFVPADDAALSVFTGGTVFTRPNNSVDNGSQDWQFVQVDTVPLFFGSGSYGFTAFDRSHYGLDRVYQLQWIPRGDDSQNLCLNIGFTSHLARLADCDGRKGEAFIVTTHVPGLTPPGAPGYVSALSVRRAGTTARHQLLTANDTGFGQVFVANKILHSPGVATAQMWSAIP